MPDSRPGDLFQPGDLVNNTYRIEAILGRGGTSDVYRARSEISGRLTALKVLKAEFSSNDDYLVLLTREEEIREIRHDAVVRYGENNRTAEGHVYLLMDYVDGPGLDRKLREGPMSADDLMIVCRRVAEGLQAAHGRKIVHRDLSPDNIILRGGDPAQAVIIDFGIAKDTNPGAETIVGNEFAGKYAYAAPEQLSGKTDARTDIYSLGALLLANFRGAAPDIGKNPMEVVQKKAERLDTSGVPEPLKTILDRMTEPDPNHRFQSAGEVLAALDGDIATGGGGDLSDATVIAPVTAARREETRAPGTQAGKAAAVPAKSGSRGPLVAVLAVAVLAAGGAGGYFSGAFQNLLGPRYPVADPYTLVVEKLESGIPRAIGNVPSEDIKTALTTRVEDGSGVAQIELASGDIADSWGNDVMAVLAAVEPLDSWRLALTGNDAALTGETTDKELHDRLTRVLASDLPGALALNAAIELRNLFLAPQLLTPVLRAHADCGPLALVNPPATGYGPDSAIMVAGTMGSAESRAALFDSLRALAGERKVTIDADVLNPTLCLIENFLPKAPSSPIDIRFSIGDKNNQINPSGRFVVGENPVIDVVLPPSVTDGYLAVSVLDVSGNVFHLLPNIGRQENAVADLRGGQPGEVPVRVAYSLDESEANGGLAFQVDDTSLGKSKVVVIHSSEPLFSSMRPTTESASGYAEALREQERSQNTVIHSLDSRTLTTARQ